MMVKANRTLNHQPEGSPEYAECSESSPAATVGRYLAPPQAANPAKKIRLARLANLLVAGGLLEK